MGRNAKEIDTVDESCGGVAGKESAVDGSGESSAMILARVRESSGAGLLAPSEVNVFSGGGVTFCMTRSVGVYHFNASAG